MVNNKTDTSLNTSSIVLGHPDTLLGDGIAHILLDAGYNVFGTARTELDLREMAFKHKPDIILFEPVLCEDFAVTIRDLREQVPGSVVALLTKKGTFNSITRSIEVGASGCISVDLTPDEFLHSLQSLLAGHILVSKDMADDVRNQSAEKQKIKAADVLSGREIEVLSHIGNGLNNREIARTLFISENTVKVHVRGILNKLDLKNRQQAAVYASKEGISASGQSETGEESVI